MILYAAILAVFVVGVLLGRRTRPGRLLPFLPQTPVTLWVDTGARMERHDLAEGVCVGIIAPVDAPDVTVIAAHPRHVYVAEGVPQYEG